MNPSLFALYAASSYWAAHSGLALWNAIRAHRLYSTHRKWMDTAITSTTQKKVALIIAAKGVSETYGRFLDFILTQNYSDYRVIFVTESMTDPAHGAIRKRLEVHDGSPEVDLMVAGLSDRTGQKIHNLRFALSHLRDDDQIVGFADADFYGRNDWLSCLMHPLNTEQSELTTGYRWFLPANNRLPNRIVGTLGIAMESWIAPGWRMMVWAGSLGISRKVYDELEIHKHLDRCITDDVRITELAQKGRKKIRYVRSAEASTPVDYTLPSLFEFGRRQYMCVGLHRKRILYCAVLFPFLYLASFALCVALLAGGNLWMLVTIGLVVLSNVVRQNVRKNYVSERFSGTEKSRLLSCVSNSWWIDPIEKFLNLVISLSALPAKKMSWGGIHYRINGPRSIEISGRDT